MFFGILEEINFAFDMSDTQNAKRQNKAYSLSVREEHFFSCANSDKPINFMFYL